MTTTLESRLNGTGKAVGLTRSQRAETSNRAGSRADRQPEYITPQSLEAEQSTIGAMLMAFGVEQATVRGVISRAHELVAPEDFYRSGHQKIVAMIYRMFWAQEVIDLITVTEALRTANLLDDAGGAAYLAACVEACPSNENIEAYARIVRQKSLERDARRIVEEAMAAMAAGENLAAATQAMKRLQDLQTQAEIGTGTPLTFTGAELMEMNLPPARWAIPEFLPVGLSLFGGKPKSRKSWLWLQGCLAVACGGRLMGQLPAPRGEALYLALEDTPQRLKDRLRKLLRGAPMPAGLHMATNWPRANAGGCAQLEKWLSAHPDCRLVVVDTLQKFRVLQKEQGNAYAQDYDAIDALKAIADKYGVAIVVIHHTTKMSADDPFMTFSGTLGLTGSADALFVIQAGRGENEAILHAQGRDLEQQKAALRWDDQLFQWNIEGDADEIGLSQERGDILDYLKAEAGLCAIHDIARHLGMERNNVKQLLWKMANDGQVKNENGRYRALKDAERPQSPITAITAITDYRNVEPDQVIDYGETTVGAILDPAGEVSEMAETVIPVTPVIAVTAVIAEKAFFKCLREDLKLKLASFRESKLNNLRDFVVWWGLNYDCSISQNSLEQHFPNWPHGNTPLTGNIPPWLDKMRA